MREPLIDREADAQLEPSEREWLEGLRPEDREDAQLELDLPPACPCQATTPQACPYAQLWGDKPEGRRPKACLRRLESVIPY